jgi:hypothetical protein
MGAFSPSIMEAADPTAPTGLLFELERVAKFGGKPIADPGRIPPLHRGYGLAVNQKCEVEVVATGESGLTRPANYRTPIDCFSLGNID